MRKFCKEWWEQYPTAYKGITIVGLGYGAIQMVLHLIAIEIGKAL